MPSSSPTSSISTQGVNLPFLLGISGVAALGGLLFGYDWVVIGGAKPFYERFMGIAGDPALQGWAMSSALLGCITGAAVAGWLGDRFGRKLPLLIAALLFMLSAIGTGAVDELMPFVLYRVLGGIGIGLASTLSPLYIAELAPANWRGRLVALNQLTIVVGILLAQITNWLLAEPVSDGISEGELLASWNVQQGWRIMFWAEAVPAGLFLGLMFLVPETPRFLLRAGQTSQATQLLRRIGGETYAGQERVQIEVALGQNRERVALKHLFAPSLRPILLLGIVLAVFQQWCGINVIFNYADEIFTAAGFSVSDLLFSIVITGSVNLLFTLVAMRSVDQWGRRRLMLLGSFGLAGIYLLLGAAYYFEWQGIWVLSLVLTAIAMYAMTLAPIVWVILAEIFPNQVRGLAMSVATLALWGACFALTFGFPLLNALLSAAGTFWLFALICLLGGLFLVNRLPETKQRSLEDIERLLQERK